MAALEVCLVVVAPILDLGLVEQAVRTTPQRSKLLRPMVLLEVVVARQLQVELLAL